MIGPRANHAARMMRKRQSEGRPEIELFSFDRVASCMLGVIMTLTAVSLGMLER